MERLLRGRARSGPFAIVVEEEASEQRELANKESASAHGKKRDKERRRERAKHTHTWWW